MGSPTPNEPIVLNDDGSISVLVFRGRTLRINVRHTALDDATGYKARFAMTTKYDETLLITADSDDGDITFVPATLPDTGTWVQIEVSDELMALASTIKGGKLDCLLEEPGGAEVPFFVGDWIVWKNVAE